jgi:methyl-accepting chemotaxis protein
MISIPKWLKLEYSWLPHNYITSRIRRKQLTALLVIALIPLVVMGIVSKNVATTTLQKQAREQLEGIRNLKNNTVQTYFAERRKDLEQRTDIMARLYVLGSDKIQAVASKKGGPTQAEMALAIQEAVSPLLKDEKTDMIQAFWKQYGFENIYLISTSGYVFHAANNGPDRHTNLLTGPFKNTNLGRLTAKVIRTNSFGMADFEKYAPAQNAPAAFMAQPVMSNGKAKLIVAVQLPISQINTIAGERTGLGTTGETYFVGNDKMLRNDSHRVTQQGVSTTILSPQYKIDSEATRSALNGQSGTKIIKNHNGIRTLSSWQPLSVIDANPVNPEGIRWALITEVDESEIEQPVRTFILVMASALAIAVLLVIGGAFLLSSGLTRQIQHIMMLFSEIGVGNFKARCRVVSRDELGMMANSLNAMLDNVVDLIQNSEERDTMQNSIMKLLTDISALTEGDLTIRAEVTEDMTGAIADSFNTMAEQLSLLVSHVKKSTLEVSTTSRQVSDTTIEMSRTSDAHATQITGAVKAIGEMSKSIRQVSEHAAQSAKVSEQAMQNALSGADAVRQTNTAMNAIRERVQEAARSIKRLGESSQEIGNIVQIINDIADRTSILALNASIQAAMAGDAGRGFAVVADEVQRLAEQSTNSTKQIETLVKNIQGEIHEAGTRMEDSIQKVVQGTQLADGAHNKLEAIESVSAQLVELVQAISRAAKQQAESSENISATMIQVGQVSSQASQQGREAATSITHLAQTSEQLRESVEVFKLAEETLDEIDEDLEILNDEDLDVLYEVA